MRQLAFTYPHTISRLRKDFFVSASNKDAVAALEQWPNWPAPYFVIEGPASSGKTHLLELWREKSRALDLPQQFNGAINHYVLDDADRKYADLERQKELFHWLNHLQNQGGTLLLSSSMPARDWIVLPDLLSRLNAAPHAWLAAPDDDLLQAAFKKMFADRQIPIDDNVLAYLLPRVERSLDAASNLVEKLDRASLQSKRRITIDLARSVLD